jgi:ABC-type antimicrobial peptide transport system permease subunit
MAQYIEYSGSTYRATAVLAAALGTIGLLLTALGVYGVVAYRTLRRTREFGIRIALGAGRGQVLALVLKESAKVALAGLLVGVPAALATTRVMDALLFGVSPSDPVAFIAGPCVIACAVLLASLLPALRATRVSPSSALRES